MSNPIKSQNNIEFYGKSVDDAVKKALKKLNVTRDDVDIKVVSEEQKGLFGMEGQKPAKIIVSLRNPPKRST